MRIFELFLLAVGLAMDAFAVSICKGLSVRKATIKESLICGLWFGAFQGLMPLLGFLVGSGFERLIRIAAPWIAFVLLSLIGLNMIREAFSNDEEETADFGFRTMFLMAVATSIDALAVGITFVAVPVTVLPAGRLGNTLFAALVIAVITFVISAIGVKIGNLFGSRYRSGSEVMGGTILLFLGLRALINTLDPSGSMSTSDALLGMLIPLAGTVLGAALVFSRRSHLSGRMRAILAGGTAGIMLSISVWGMIETAARELADLAKPAVLPVFLGFWAGIALQYLLDRLVPHTHAFADVTEGPESGLKPETKLMLAEVIHHVPEGIALGAIYAVCSMNNGLVSSLTALTLALALAVQNFPEAMFVSLPVRETGTGRDTSFLMGVVSGVPIPILGALTLILMVLFPAALPYVMSLAGGAMIYTTVEEFPQMSSGEEGNKGALAFAVGFSLVMLLTLGTA